VTYSNNVICIKGCVGEGAGLRRGGLCAKCKKGASSSIVVKKKIASYKLEWKGAD